MAGEVDRVLTAAEARAMQEEAGLLGWFLSDRDPRHLGRYVARPHTADHAGGRFLPVVLAADNLADLHAQLPAVVRRRAELPFPLGPDWIELWD